MRPQRDLAEHLVAVALVWRERAVVVGLIVTAVFRPIVRPVEEDTIRDNRPARVEVDPAAVLLVTGGRAGLEARGHRIGLELEADLTGEPVGAGLAHRVDGEPAGPIEVNGASATLRRRDLRDIVRRRLGRERAEERQRHVDAVELIDVVLTAAAGAGTARPVWRVLDAGDEFDQIAVLLANRQPFDLFVRQAALDRRRVAIDERRAGGDRDRLGDPLHAELHINDGVLEQLHLGLARDGLHARERELRRVVARWQRRQAVLARGSGDGRARARQDIRTNFDGDARQRRAVRRRDFAA